MKSVPVGVLAIEIRSLSSPLTDLVPSKNSGTLMESLMTTILYIVRRLEVLLRGATKGQKTGTVEDHEVFCRSLSNNSSSFHTNFAMLGKHGPLVTLYP